MPWHRPDKHSVPTDPNNIAKAISKDLPNVPVFGQNQNYHYSLFTGNYSPWPGDSTTVYINGK